MFYVRWIWRFLFFTPTYSTFFNCSTSYASANGRSLLLSVYFDQLTNQVLHRLTLGRFHFKSNSTSKHCVLTRNPAHF